MLLSHFEHNLVKKNKYHNESPSHASNSKSTGTTQYSFLVFILHCNKARIIKNQEDKI